MKKVFVIIATAGIIAACNNHAEKKEDDANDTAAAKMQDMIDTAVSKRNSMADTTPKKIEEVKPKM